MKITYKGVNYKLSFCSYFEPCLDLEAEIMLRNLEKKFPYDLVKALRDETLDRINNQSHKMIGGGYIPRSVKARQVRITKATLYNLDAEKDVDTGLTRQYIGDPDNKLIGKKVALKKLLQNISLGKEFNTLIWDWFKLEFKINKLKETEEKVQPE